MSPRKGFFRELFKGSVPQPVPPRDKQPNSRYSHSSSTPGSFQGILGQIPGIGVSESRVSLELQFPFSLLSAHSFGIRLWSRKIHFEFLWHRQFQQNFWSRFQNKSPKILGVASILRMEENLFPRKAECCSLQKKIKNKKKFLPFTSLDLAREILSALNYSSLFQQTIPGINMP